MNIVSYVIDFKKKIQVNVNGNHTAQAHTHWRNELIPRK